MAKIPPPPPIANQDPTFNRWLLELTSILNAQGDINPGTVVGLDVVIASVAANTAAIAALNVTVAGNSADIVALQGDISTINGNITSINAAILTLNARAQVLNGVGAPAAGLGNVNDWYANIGGAVGARIYVKTGAATWTAFPF